MTDRSNGIGVVCHDCPFQSVWFSAPDRVSNKQEIMTNHEVAYTSPDEIRTPISEDDEVLYRYDDQDTFAFDGGNAVGDTEDVGPLLESLL